MRQSDRYVTPAVIVTLILSAAVVVLALVAVTAYLTARGIDAAPVMEVVTSSVAAATGLMTVALSLANRATVAKTERNTGTLANRTGELADAVIEVAETMPRPRAPFRHTDPDDTALLEPRRGAPAPPGR